MPPRSASLSAARSNRCSTAIISREVNRSSPFPVLPQRHQLGRRHRAHSGIELVLAVAVPDGRTSPGRGRERRLLPRDRVQCDPRLAMIFSPFARAIRAWSSTRSASSPCSGIRDACRPDLVLRLKLDPLRRQCAMVDPRINIELGKPFVDMIGPRLAPPFKSSALFHSRTFWPNPSGPTSRIDSMTCACGLGWPSLPMSQCTLRSATMPRSTNCLFDEIARQLDALRLIQLARN
jgi:hypothetical protein